MKRKNIDYDLQSKARKYFTFLQQVSNADAEIEKDLIGKLSSSLKEDILIKANGSILKNAKFFANFSEKTIRKLVFKLKHMRYYPEEIIFCVKRIKNNKNLLFSLNNNYIIVYKIKKFSKK